MPPAEAPSTSGPDTEPFLRTPIATTSMRFTAIYPYDPLARSRIRSYRTLSILARIAPTAVYYPGYTSGTRGFPVPAGVTLHEAADPGLLRLLRFASAIATRRSLSFAFYRSILRDAVRAESPSLVFAERIQLPARLDPAIPLVYDTVDRFKTQVSSLHKDARGLRRLGYGYDMHTIAAEQARYCNSATLVLCTTDAEASGLQEDGVSAPIQSFLHRSQTDWTDAGRFEAAVRQAQRQRDQIVRGRGKLATFHGRSSYPANIAAARFIEQTLATALPKTGFLIFGEQWAERLEGNLSFLGRQPDLSLLAAADYGVFPLSTAVGIPNKVIECLAYGLPIVITPALHAILPKWIKENLSERIRVSPLGNFAECIRAHEAHLERSELASEYFRSIYGEMVESSERNLAASLEDLSRRRLKSRASRQRQAARAMPLIPDDLRAASFDAANGP